MFPYLIRGSFLFLSSKNHMNFISNLLLCDHFVPNRYTYYYVLVLNYIFLVLYELKILQKVIWKALQNGTRHCNACVLYQYTLIAGKCTDKVENFTF